MNVGISSTFNAVNLYLRYGNKDQAVRSEQMNVINPGKGRSSDCIQCGACEGVCPQHIEIRDELVKATEILQGWPPVR